jgi:hypothetical protein
VELYPTKEMKIALCLQSGMIAKQTAVSELGIGEELTFSLVGWVADRMVAIASLAQEFMDEDPEKRLMRVAMAATIMRKGWGCDSLSFMAEAFCSMDYERTKGRDLRALFAQPGTPVMECLTVTHVDRSGVTMATQPYKIALGRKVEWLMPVMNSDPASLRNAKYPQVLSAILHMSIEKVPYDSEIFYQALADGLAEDGFHIQWTFE